MQTTTIPATPEQSAASRDRTGGLFTADLPADALVDGDWITAPGAGEGAVVYVHGGGFAHTNPERERVLAYHFSAAARRPALRVEYRLAPAHPYPAALEDALAAYEAVLARGIAAEQVVFIGESAGATLILSMLLELKRTGRPLPGGAVAISPSTDMTLSSDSLTANDGKDVITHEVLKTIAADYLAGADPAGAPQSPIHGEPAGLPPLLLAVGADELLLDDARRFAAAADAAGVSTQLDVYEGMPHAFHLSTEAGTLLGRIGDWLAAPVREFTVSDPKAGPYALTEGPDGALWFTLVHEGAIGRRSASGELSVYRVGAGPTVIAPGPDGALWFSEFKSHRIGRIAADGTATSFAPASPEGGPFGIAAGPDGALWFTLITAGKVGRITAEGAVTEYDAPGATPSAIVAGPDGAMWFTLNQGNAIGRITMDGETVSYPLPTEGAAPVGIAVGPDGALWFTEIGAGRIGRITVAGEITEFELPNAAARPHAVVAGPDGALWFTEWGSGRIGRITPAGEVSSYALSDPDSEPHGIAVHQGAVWCALETGALARIAP